MLRCQLSRTLVYETHFFDFMWRMIVINIGKWFWMELECSFFKNGVCQKEGMKGFYTLTCLISYWKRTFAFIWFVWFRFPVVGRHRKMGYLSFSILFIIYSRKVRNLNTAVICPDYIAAGKYIQASLMMACVIRQCLSLGFFMTCFMAIKCAWTIQMMNWNKSSVAFYCEVSPQNKG